MRASGSIIMTWNPCLWIDFDDFCVEGVWDSQMKSPGFKFNKARKYSQGKSDQNPGQISIIPKPELGGFWGSSLIKPPFRVTSADVVIICPENHVDTHICSTKTQKKHNFLSG